MDYGERAGAREAEVVQQWGIVNQAPGVETLGEIRRGKLRRGRQLEAVTLIWNVVGIVVLAAAGSPPGQLRSPGSDSTP
jgi:hypothetical protein